MAKLLNVTRSSYGYYESGRNLPSVETLAVLARIFRTSTDYLLGVSDKQMVDAYETIEHLLNNIECATFNGCEMDSTACEMLACSLEHSLRSTKIVLKD